MTSRDYFKGKRIAVIGLGANGEMVEDVSFLVKAGAFVGIYDLKSEARLKNHLVFLRNEGLANYVCGSIPEDDLLDMDLIILSHEYPRESGFLKGAKGKNIPIEYPETLFFKKSPPVTVVGVMGECGKATVVSMLEPMLKAACRTAEDQGFFVIDPESDEGIIAHLKKVKSGDLILMRVIEPMMRELFALRISPQVAIFTTIPAKGSYDQSPFEILTFQTYNNFIIASDEVIDATRRYKELPRGKMLRTKPTIIPVDWELKNMSNIGARRHDRDNAALALQAAHLFKVDEETTRRILQNWKPLHGRLELVKKVKNVEFYNDAASMNCSSTQAALQSITKGGAKEAEAETGDSVADAAGEIAGEASVNASLSPNNVLIFGGAQTLSDYRALYSLLPQYVHTLVLLPGSGTLRERQALGRLEKIEIRSARSIEEATQLAFEHAKKGDKVLFSPGFEAAGLDSSRKERSERFVRAVRAL
jgi:UDP-N-acetylmuramoylalanine-D-glutamate ligase